MRDLEPWGPEATVPPSVESEHSSPSRLHPLTLLFTIGDSIRAFIIPGVLVLLFAWGDRYDLFFMVFFLPFVVSAVFRYLFLTYELTKTELIIREGVIHRRERHILLERIHNVDTVQTPLQRLLKVVEVSIETAGGAMEAEARLKVVNRSVADEIRSFVRAVRSRRGETAQPGDASSAQDARAPEAGPAAIAGRIPPAGIVFGEARPETNAAIVDSTAPPLNGGVTGLDGETGATGARHEATEILRLDARGLVAYGIVSGRGLAMVGAAMAIAWQFDAFENLDEQIQTYFPALAKVPTAWALVVGVPAVFVLLKVLSVLWALIKLFGFRLTRTDDGLHSVCGLLTRREATIPDGRIQSLSIRQNLLQRVWGRFSLRSDTAGGDASASDQVNRFWVVPIARMDQLPGLLEAILPGTRLDHLEWRKPHPRVRRRLFLRWVLLAAFAFAWMMWRETGWWAAAPLGLLPIGWLAAVLRYRMLRHAFDGQRLHVIDGLIGRQHCIVPMDRVQAVGFHQTPIDRWHGLASVNVATAGHLEVVPKLRVFGVAARHGLRLHRRLRDCAGAASARPPRTTAAASAPLDQTSAV